MEAHVNNSLPRVVSWQWNGRANHYNTKPQSSPLELHLAIFEL